MARVGAVGTGPASFFTVTDLGPSMWSLCVAGLGFLTAWRLQDGQLLPAADGFKDEYSVSKAE